MSLITLNSIEYYYISPEEKLFNNLTLNISTEWKLGLIGRNGRGKTTLLNLINKKIYPVQGSIYSDTKTSYFPYHNINLGDKTLIVIKENIAPYTYLEIMMDSLSARSDKESMEEYGKCLEEYQDFNGYEIEAMIEKEFYELGLTPDLLNRDFETLSGGEQTKALLVSLFLKKDRYPLIDEPTNHLDMEGRQVLGEYLSKKRGFLLVSHDRYFLDLCIDHIMSINKSDVKITKGNYSQWKYNAELVEEFEKKKNENIKKEIKSLETAARKRRQWSEKKEKEIPDSGDKGFVSHRSAKLMKRALNIERRKHKKSEEKKTLLKNIEKERNLKLDVSVKSKEKLATFSNANLILGNKTILDNFSLTVNKSDRVAIIGSNGCGKTSLLRIFTNELKLDDGLFYKPNYVTISYARQNPLWDNGYLRKILQNEKMDEIKFRNIMGVLGVTGNIFERPLETFSKGEIKKIELCKSFLDSYDLLIWDEPLNYLDIMSREQIERVILKYKPTLIFTEHDKIFIKNIATKVIRLNN